MWQIYLHKTVVRFGAGKALCEISTVADTIPPSMAGSRVDHNLSRHGSV